MLYSIYSAQFDKLTIPFVYVLAKGGHLQNRYISRHVWYPALKACGLLRRNPYQTRHTAATLWMAAGESPEWIAQQMGHSSTTMLFRVYSRYVPNLTRQDGSAFERILSEKFSVNGKEAGYVYGTV